jgi:hypothetical protein
MIEAPLDTSVALYRVARKRWACNCPGNGHENCPHDDCAQEIAPGERYVEYLGEAPAYQSGSRYRAGSAPGRRPTPDNARTAPGRMDETVAAGRRQNRLQAGFTAQGV